jgi:hypothetical protein
MEDEIAGILQSLPASHRSTTKTSKPGPVPVMGRASSEAPSSRLTDKGRAETVKTVTGAKRKTPGLPPPAPGKRARTAVAPNPEDAAPRGSSPLERTSGGPPPVAMDVAEDEEVVVMAGGGAAGGGKGASSELPGGKSAPVVKPTPHRGDKAKGAGLEGGASAVMSLANSGATVPLGPVLAGKGKGSAEGGEKGHAAAKDGTPKPKAPAKAPPARGKKDAKGSGRAGGVESLGREASAQMKTPSLPPPGRGILSVAPSPPSVAMEVVEETGPDLPARGKGPEGGARGGEKKGPVVAKGEAGKPKPPTGDTERGRQGVDDDEEDLVPFRVTPPSPAAPDADDGGDSGSESDSDSSIRPGEDHCCL